MTIAKPTVLAAQALSDQRLVFAQVLLAPPYAPTALMGQMTGRQAHEAAGEGWRTVPPREHGGNCDIKNLSRGSRAVRKVSAMPFRWNPREHLALAAFCAKWVAIGVPAGAVIGSAVALFLWTLNLAIETFWNNSWLLFLLPFGGMAVGVLYHFFGKSVEAGNNLVMEQIHEPGGGVPARMGPLVLIGTVVTHLFGGSAGREGTAI
jgi:hypothetical protein